MLLTFEDDKNHALTMLQKSDNFYKDSTKEETISSNEEDLRGVLIALI